MTAANSGESRLTRPLIVLTIVCAFCFGAIVRSAFADYHVTCVGHGFVNDGSTSDGSFFGRIEAGCSSTLRRCELYTNGSFDGSQTVTGTTAQCNAWSSQFGSYTECASTTHVYDQGVFSDHVHKSANWCG
jgi:hypothetical protein